VRCARCGHLPRCLTAAGGAASLSLPAAGGAVCFRKKYNKISSLTCLLLLAQSSDPVLINYRRFIVDFNIYDKTIKTSTDTFDSISFDIAGILAAFRLILHSLQSQRILGSISFDIADILARFPVILHSLQSQSIIGSISFESFRLISHSLQSQSILGSISFDIAGILAAFRCSPIDAFAVALASCVGPRCSLVRPCRTNSGSTVVVVIVLITVVVDVESAIIIVTSLSLPVWCSDGGVTSPRLSVPVPWAGEGCACETPRAAFVAILGSAAGRWGLCLQPAAYEP